MKALILNIALAGVLASTVSAADLTGEYRVSMPEVASALALRPDGTFEYMFIYGAADYFARGTWRAESGAVVLNTAGRKEAPFTLVRERKAPAKLMRVRIQAPNGRGVPHIDVTLSGARKLTARTDESGWAEFPSAAGAKQIAIHVPVYDIDAGPFAVQAETNEAVFQINGDAITTVQFRDEKLRISGDALQMTYWKGEKPLRYVKE